MASLPHWDIVHLSGHHCIGPSTPDQMSHNTSTTQQVFPFVHLCFDVDIWRFTLFWTFAIFGVVFLAAGLWAWSVYFFKTKWAILIPVLYVLSGEFIAFVSGTIIGTTLFRLDSY
jgi:hypothetical protein